jgi:hypothetical protein
LRRCRRTESPGIKLSPLTGDGSEWGGFGTWLSFGCAELFSNGALGSWNLHEKKSFEEVLLLLCCVQNYVSSLRLCFLFFSSVVWHRPRWRTELLCYCSDEVKERKKGLELWDPEHLQPD